MPVAAAEIIGREAELGRLEASLSGGLPVAIVLDGEAGIGKTTLWRAGVDLARARGHRVVTAAPAESEAHLSFVALRDLVGEVFDEVEASLPEPQRVALATALLRDDRGPVEEGAVRAALARTLDVAAASGPLLIAVDDVHWLDAPSASALEFAFRRLNDRAVAILLGRRTGEALPAPLGLGRALPQDRTTLLRLDGLALGALGRVLRTRLGASLPRRTLVRIHEASAGNPFFALELARAFGPEVSTLPPGAALPLTPELRELLERRLAEAPAPVQDLLLLCAALAAPTMERVMRLGTAAAAIEAAVDHELLTVGGDRLRFAHPLIASAAYHRASTGTKLALHRRLAAAAEDPEERALHLCRATVAPAANVAAAIEEGADRAWARSAVDSAGWLALEAWRLTPRSDPDEVVRRGLKVCEYHAALGTPPELERMIESVVAAASPGPLRARALFEAATRTEDVDEKLRLSNEALREAGDDHEVQARIRRVQSRALEGAGRIDEAAERALVELESADAARDPELIVRAIAHVGRLRFETGHGVDRELMQRGIELESSLDSFLAFHSATSSLADQLMWSDELDEARALFEALLERTVRAGAVNSLLALHFQLAELENRAARWLAARDHAREGLELAREVGFGSLQGLLLFHEAVAEAHLGRLDRARARVADAYAISRGTHEELYAVFYESLLGFVDLTDGRWEDACTRLTPLPGRAAAMGVRDPGYFHLVPNVVEALVAVGRLGDAEAEIERLDALARPVGRHRALAFAARGRALVAAARGETEPATRNLDEALACHEHYPDPFERARTLLVLGVVRRRARDRRAGRVALERATAEFELLGAARWAERARAELGRFGGRPRATGELTPTERRVAELVAEGRSNKEVAATVFVTPKTVEVYLSRIYAKLGIRSRTELARRIFEEATAGKL